jgi:hypothetical protein
MLPFLLLGVVAFILFGGLLYEHRVAARLHRCDWNGLLLQLHPVDRQPLSAVAQEYLHPHAHQIQTEPSAVWTALEGLQGVHRMRRNARILIALASYTERWNFEEGVIVAERIRRDALQLRRATFQIMLRMYLHTGQTRVPFYLQEAVASYHLMTERLLALYQTSHSGLYPRLAQAIDLA